MQSLFTARRPSAIAPLVRRSTSTAPSTQSRSGRALAWVALTSAALAWLAIFNQRAEAQFRTRILPPESEEGRFHQNRQLVRQLKDAEALIAAGDAPRAVAMLAALLEAPADSFVPVGEDGEYRTMKSEAARLLGTLPYSGLEEYRVRYATTAARRLQAAVESGDSAVLSEILQRYLHTPAGADAAWLLASRHLDERRPLAAAACWSRLQQALQTAPAAVGDRWQPQLSLHLAAAWLQAGFPQRAADEMQALAQSHPRAAIELEGRNVLVFGGDPLAVPRQIATFRRASTSSFVWRLPGGNDSGRAAWHLPPGELQFAWSAPAYDAFFADAGPGSETTDRGVLEVLDVVDGLLASMQTDPGLPCALPVLAGELAVFRTATRLVAVEVATGRRRWETAVEADMQSLLRRGFSKPDRDLLRGSGGTWWPGDDVRQRIVERAWLDELYGRAVADDQRIYCLSDRGFAQGQFPSYRPPTNRLVAWRLANGERLWAVGPDIGGRAPSQFLGPPLPLSGRLYLLAEENAEILLLELDAANGAVLWRQPLCEAAEAAIDHPLRRWRAISPIHSDGILVCPTGVGVTVAVDPHVRQLLWGTLHSEPPLHMQRMDHANRWNRPTPHCRTIAAAGKVLQFSRDGGLLTAFDLLEGRQLWHLDCRAASWCWGPTTADGRLLLVDVEGVSALDLSTGQRTWQRLFPKNVPPAGEGFRQDDRYFIPMEDGALFAVDLVTLEVSRERLDAGGWPTTPRGNLAIAGHRLLALDRHGLHAFEVRPRAVETAPETDGESRLAPEARR